MACVSGLLIFCGLDSGFLRNRKQGSPSEALNMFVFEGPGWGLWRFAVSGLGVCGSGC